MWDGMWLGFWLAVPGWLMTLGISFVLMNRSVSPHKYFGFYVFSQISHCLPSSAASPLTLLFPQVCLPAFLVGAWMTICSHMADKTYRAYNLSFQTWKGMKDPLIKHVLCLMDRERKQMKACWLAKGKALQWWLMWTSRPLDYSSHQAMPCP